MQEWIKQVLESSQFGVAVLPAAFLLGIFGAISSGCNIAALGAIAGYSGTSEDSDRRSTIFAGLFFVIGTIVALGALGAVAGFIGQVAGSVLGKYWKVFAGLTAIFFGLAALNLVPFKLPRIKSAANSGGPLKAAVFGLVVGGAATACTVGCNPLLAIPLGAAVLQGHTLWGVGILAAFAAGFSLPLAAILVGLSYGKSTMKSKKAAAVARIAGGVLLVGVGFYLLATIGK